MSLIREPAVSGSFYPDSPTVLKKTIETYLQNAKIEQMEGEPKGLVSPHAGYMYSGQVAAYGYKALMGKNYDTVIILAPSHRVYFEGLAVMEKGAYKTPLGIVPIDEDLVSKILRLGSELFLSNFSTHLGEHSVEVQIPFLQMVFGDFRIVPLIMGVQNRHIWREAALIIHTAIREEKKKILLLASTDLSHYYPYEKAKKLDSLVIRHVEAFDVEGMERDFENQTYEACGGGPMITVMMLSQMMGAKRGLVLNYANSGDVSGDKSAVVGYLSAVFLK